MSFFDQANYCCRFEWGQRGVEAAAARGDVLVIVDVLRFSTAVATAVQQGGLIYPCLESEGLSEIARLHSAEIAAKGTEKGRYSLSPSSYDGLEPGTRIALASANGALCARYGQKAAQLLVGAFVNAQAVGHAVTKLLETTDHAVTVVACGEQWPTPSEEGRLRFAIEDYLGAGAVLSFIQNTHKSPEAKVCEAAFLASKDRLEELLLGSGSGQELIARNCRDDIVRAARLNVFDVVPKLEDGWIKASTPK